MKKIIAAIDGLKYSESTVQFAVQIAKQANAHLVGVMLDDITYTSYKAYELVVKQKMTEEKLKKYEAKDKETRLKSAAKFEEACRKAGITFAIHHDKSIALQELLHESIYCDLLLIDGKETLTHYEEKRPTRFIRDLLTDVQCPVLIVPSKYKPFEKIFLLFDGEPSSMYAIKMFSYLFPFLENTETEIISVKNPGQTMHLPDNKLMKEFMKRHYPVAGYKVIKGLPEIEIVQYLKQQPEHMLIVLGAYRRGRVSRWFRESMADYLMKEMAVPLFIAHNK
jgi:nucleotide-binding universal stress UspA family protein